MRFFLTSLCGGSDRTSAHGGEVFPHIPVRRFRGWNIFRPGKCGTSLCGCSVRTSAQGSAALPCEDVPSELPHREVRHFPVRMCCLNFRTRNVAPPCAEVLSALPHKELRHLPVRTFWQNFRTRKCGSSQRNLSNRRDNNLRN